MGGQDLAQFATGLTSRFFGGLLEDRQTEQKRKDAELARQLAAYHALLEHPDTPESEIPNILDAQAKLLKAEKDFAPVTAHMREAMKRQVPYGAERETLQSRVNRVRSVPGEPTETVVGSQLNTHPITPLGGTSPFTVSTPALATVPPEPVMYQPTAEYGTLTQGEASDLRKGQLYGSQQEAQLRRQLKIQSEAAENAAEREVLRTQRAKDVEELRQKGRIAVVKTTFDEKAKLLGPAAQAKMDAERQVYKNSLMVGPNAMNEHDAEVASYNLFRSQVDTKLEEQKQKLVESKAKIERWKNMTANEVERIGIAKNKGTGITGGMSVNTAREFTMRTGTLRTQLASVLRQLESVYKESEGAPDPVQQATIQRLEAEKTDLWVKIDGVRDGLLTRSPSQVPSAPQPTRVGADPLGLFKK